MEKGKHKTASSPSTAPPPSLASFVADVRREDRRIAGQGARRPDARTPALRGPGHLPVVYLWNSCILSGHTKTFICTHWRNRGGYRCGSGRTNMSTALICTTEHPSKEEKLEENLAGIRASWGCSEAMPSASLGFELCWPRTVILKTMADLLHLRL